MPIAASSVPDETRTLKPASRGHGLRREHAERAEGDASPCRRTAASAPPKPGRAAGLRAEQQQRQAQHDIDADLAEDREERGDRGRRGRIGGRQPEAQRPHAGLDEEGDAEDGRAGFEQRRSSAGTRGMRRARSAMFSVPVTP